MTKARDIASATTPNANAALLATFPHKNLIINGAMQVWQRGTTVDTASSGSYFCDRWRIGHSGTDGNVDIDRSTDVPSGKGFGYSQKISMDASETSLGASDLVNLQQRIEAQNLQHLAKGTSDALKVTASFWVKSSVASTYTLEIKDADNTRNISASYIINAANTWEYKTLTFAGDTSGVLNNDNGTGFEFIFWLDAGTDFTSGTFSTAWQAQDNAERVYDTTGWLESTSPEFYLTGVQLEVGDTATPFEHRSYGDELARCQRYFQIYGGKADSEIYSGWAGNTSGYYTTIRYMTQMRAAPTLTINGSWSSTNINSASLTYGSKNGVALLVAPAGTGRWYWYADAADDTFTADAEL
jgi:hypothetical protein